MIILTKFIRTMIKRDKRVYIKNFIHTMNNHFKHAYSKLKQMSLNFEYDR